MSEDIIKRLPPQKMAKKLAKYLRQERPNYIYLKRVFQHLRNELEIEIPKPSEKNLPYVPKEEDIKKYYLKVWESKNIQDLVIVKTLIYTGVRVSELINIKLYDIELDEYQIRINQGKGSKDRIVPFPRSFRELLSIQIENKKKDHAVYLFESTWHKKYTDRGIRRILEKYSKKAGLEVNISPHKLRHFFLTWLKKQGIDDAFIQPYSGHESRKSLEIYSKLSIKEAQEEYDKNIENFPI
ncbi:MAG: integrase [Thiotrichales bacterium]|nr:MAG: integrase [Thiotrichales bacterium]